MMLAPYKTPPACMIKCGVYVVAAIRFCKLASARYVCSRGGGYDVLKNIR